MFCGKCGKEIIDGAKFCAACGAPVGRNEAGVQTLPEHNEDMGTPIDNRQMEATEKTDERPDQREAWGKMEKRNLQPTTWRIT